MAFACLIYQAYQMEEAGILCSILDEGRLYTTQGASQVDCSHRHTCGNRADKATSIQEQFSKSDH